MSGYWRRFRLQYRIGNKEVEVDLWGLLGMCIPTWVKFCLLSRRKVILQIFILNHSGWAWPILKKLIPGFSDVCLSWLRTQKMNFKTVSLSSNCRLREKVAGRFRQWLLGGPRDPKRRGHVEITTAEMVSVRENSSQQNSQKTVFTQIFRRNFWLWNICQNIFDTSWDFERDKFTGKCFLQNLEKWRGYWVPETLVEHSKTRNEHGSGTQIAPLRALISMYNSD
jgi:hypothetical protein